MAEPGKPISERHESFVEEPHSPYPTGGLSPGYRPPDAGELFGKLLEILGDPRNAWIGLGPLSTVPMLGALGRLFNMGRGSDVLRRYAELGGTPKSLRKVLRGRKYETDDIDEISESFHRASDPAGQASRERHDFDPRLRSPRDIAERNARAQSKRDDIYQQEGDSPYLRRLQRWSPVQERDFYETSEHMRGTDPRHVLSDFALSDPENQLPTTARKLSDIRESWKLNLIRQLSEPSSMLPETRRSLEKDIQSISEIRPIGHQAIDAMSSQIRRMLGDENFMMLQSLNKGPKPVPAREYWKEFPINPENKSSEIVNAIEWPE